MKVLLAAAGVITAMMCFAIVVLVEVLTRLLPVLIVAVLLWALWRIWQCRRHAHPVSAVPLLVDPALEPAAAVPALLMAQRPLPAPPPEVFLAAGDHLGLRPPLTPLRSPEDSDVRGRVLTRRSQSRVR